MKRKGQAALEFIMTYSWAFMIIIVTIGVIAYYVIGDVSEIVPDKCLFDDSFSCVEVVSGTQGNAVNVIINTKNLVGKEIKITGVEADFNSETEVSSGLTYAIVNEDDIETVLTAGKSVEIGAGEEFFIKIDFLGATNDNININLAITYEILKDGYFPKTSSGIITTKVDNKMSCVGYGCP